MASSVVQIDVRSLRSAQLQIELKKRGLSSSGKKSELRRRLEEALAKERGIVTEKAEGATATATTNNKDENNVSNETTAEQSITDKPVTMTTDNVVATAPRDTATPGSSEDKTAKVEDSVKEKDVTVIATTEEPVAPAVVQTQEDKVVDQIKSEEKPGDKEVEKEAKLVENTTVQQQSDDVAKNIQPTTEAASSAEVSMEMEDLVVHTVDEDDFKMEEQSRDHVNKKAGELPSSTTNEQGEVDSPSVKKRKLHLQGTAGTPMTSSERKRKWKSSSSKSSATTISSDVLKKIIPDSVTKEVTGDTVDDVFPDSSTASHDPATTSEESTKPVTMTTVTAVGTEDDSGEQERLRLAEEETRRRIEIRLREKQDGEQRQQQPVKPSDVTESDLTPNKEVIVDYNQPIRVRSPSTNCNPPSAILHVTNLVRPFALSQLKELLSEDGSVVADGFWINKIKSHCFAVYENVDAAMATRNRLDGVRWPVTNPKVITVDFSNEEEVIVETGGTLAVSTTVAMEHSDVVTKQRDSVKEKHVPKAEERPKQVVKEEPMQVEESSTAPQEGGAGVQEVENKSAVNRLDELFKKTLATPQIYWLPLTTEEGEKRLAAIKADEELRKQRREQRQKDREEKERLEQEEREKRRKAREEEREKRRRQRSTSRHRSDSRSRHRSRSRSRHRSHSKSRHQR